MSGVLLCELVCCFLYFGDDELLTGEYKSVQLMSILGIDYIANNIYI